MARPGINRRLLKGPRYPIGGLPGLLWQTIGAGFAIRLSFDKAAASGRHGIRLDQLVVQGQGGACQGPASSSLAAYGMAKYYKVEIEDHRFGWRRNRAQIQFEATADGIYVIRTKVPQSSLKAEDAKATYHSLSHVEWAFRSLKGLDLQIRSIHHRLEGRVRAHVFLCMLAYYVEWHLRKAWAPLLFDGEPQGTSNGKRRTRKTIEGLPIMTFKDLLADLGGLTRNQVRFSGATAAVTLTRPRAPINRRPWISSLFPISCSKNPNTPNSMEPNRHKGILTWVLTNFGPVAMPNSCFGSGRPR